MDTAAFKLATILIAAIISASQLSGQAKPFTDTKASERLIWRGRDTIYMVFPKRVKDESPFGSQVANQLPDTLRLLLLGDSAVTLNMPTNIYYTKEHTEALKRMAYLRSLVPDSLTKR